MGVVNSDYWSPIQLKADFGHEIRLFSKTLNKKFSHANSGYTTDWSNWASGLDSLKSQMSSTANSTATTTLPSHYDPLSMSGYQVSYIRNAQLGSRLPLITLLVATCSWTQSLYGNVY